MKIYKLVIMYEGGEKKLTELTALDEATLHKLASGGGRWHRWGSNECGTMENIKEQARIILSLRGQGAPI